MSTFATNVANSNYQLLARMLKNKKAKPSPSQARTHDHQISDPLLYLVSYRR